MADKVLTGAARQFSIDQFGGPLSEIDATVTCQTTYTTLAKGNGDRVGLVIVNLGANNVNIAPNSAVSSTLGILLAAGGGNVTMDVRDDFTIVTREWGGVANGGTSAVYVLEIFRVSQ